MDKRVRLAELIMIVVAIIWGTGFVVTKLAMDNGIGVYYLLFIRFLVASILLMFVIFLKKIKIKTHRLIFDLADYSINKSEPSKYTKRSRLLPPTTQTNHQSPTKLSLLMGMLGRVASE